MSILHTPYFDVGDTLVSAQEIRDDEFGGQIVEVKIFFERIAISIKVSDDDELVINLIDSTRKNILDKNSSSPCWRDAYGKSISNYWIMKNNKGYEDALQFFLQNNLGDRKFIQIIASGAAIEIYSLQECL